MRLHYILFMILLLFLIPIPAAFASKSTNYGSPELVLSGLNWPFIMSKTPTGFFFETTEDGFPVIYYYDSVGGRVKRLLSEDGAIEKLDWFGGCLYYVYGKYEQEYPYRIIYQEVRSYCNGSKKSLYRTQNSYIEHIAVGRRGVYVATSQLEITQHGWIFHPPAKILLLRRGGSVDTLVTLKDAQLIGNMKLSPVGILFTAEGSNSSYMRIYRYSKRGLRVLLDKPTENNGYIGYLTLDSKGNLYYIYRQRSDVFSSNQWGYLEIGRFTLRDLLMNGEPEILYTRRYENKSVLFWYPPEGFAQTYDDKLFFTFLLYKPGNEELQIARLDIRTGSLTYMVKTDEWSDLFSFAITFRGDLYFAKTSSGEIWRIRASNR